MYYDSYHLLGMHLIWCFFWGSLVFWVFATPYYVSGQQKKKGSALEPGIKVIATLLPTH
jgi:putative membrane protein